MIDLRLLTTALGVILHFNFAVASANVAAETTSNTNCKALISGEQSTAAMTELEQSYLSLVEVSLQKNFISNQDLESIIAKLQQGHLANPLTGKTLNSDSLPYKKTFDKLLSKLSTASNTLIASVTNLNTNAKAVVETKQKISHEIQEFYAPYEAHKLKLLNSQHYEVANASDNSGRNLIVLNSAGETRTIDVNSPTEIKVIYKAQNESQFTYQLFAKNGREIRLRATASKTLDVYDTNNPNNTTTLDIDMSRAHPKYFVTKDGREIVALVDRHERLHLIDLDNPQKIIQFDKTVRVTADMQYFVTSEGKEILSAAAGATIHLININDILDIQTIQTKNMIYSDVRFFITKTGQNILSFSAHDSNLYLIDILNPKLNQNFYIESSASAPTYFRAKNGKEMLAIGSESFDLLIFDLADMKHPIEVQLGAGINSSPIYFISQDEKELIVTGCKNGSLYIIDLKDPHHPKELPLGDPIYHDPIHLVDKNGKDIVGIKTHSQHYHQINLFSKPTQREVQ